MIGPIRALQRLFAVLVVGACGAVVSAGTAAAAAPAKPPDAALLARTAQQTVKRLETESASWTSVQEHSPGVRWKVQIVRTPHARRIIFRAPQADNTWKATAEIIERNGLWYVGDSEGYRMYRPYEATLSSPHLYWMLALSRIRTALDVNPDVMRFESLKDSVVTYRVPLRESERKALQKAAESVKRLPAEAQKRPATRWLLQRIEDELEHGLPFQFDTTTGISVLEGHLDKRLGIEEFQWQKELPPDVLSVDGRDWKDHTARLLPGQDHDLIMLEHEARWRPGEGAASPALTLVSRKTGETRQVPFQHGVAAAGCFSADRRKAYLLGSNPDLGRIRLYEVNLDSGDNLLLDDPALRQGVITSLAMSPDGRTLALTHYGDKEAASQTRRYQLFLVDIVHGTARMLGKPLDTEAPSWLPDSSGMVLVTRKYPILGRPPFETIHRIDLKGGIEPIREGSSPVVLTPRRAILYQDRVDGRRWKTCNLDGKDVKVLGDGLADFASPSGSRDGRKVVMIKQSKQEGPRPYVVNTLSGETEPIPVGPGFWDHPRW